MILHLGAPKCGSSALQTALSRHPVLTDTDGRRYEYSALLRGEHLIAGRPIASAAGTSPYGYLSWPNFKAGDMSSPVFPAFEKALDRATRIGRIPILSSEGWLVRHNAFGKVLAKLGHPRIDVVAFLRPPADWANAAFWQWGVWTAGTMDRWLAHGRLPFTFGTDLERWSAIPGVRIRFGRSQPDVVARFAGLYGLDLSTGIDSNRSVPAALIEILLRNRHLRPSGHGPVVDFAFGRWCPPAQGERPWAIEPRHGERLRHVLERERAALLRIGSEDEKADLLADPSWTETSPSLRTPFIPGVDRCSPEAFRTLCHSLDAGLSAAARAARKRLPPLPPAPTHARATGSEWDEAIVARLDTLTELDALIRRPSVWTRARLAHAIWDHRRSSRSR
ncbi:hypothetical protein [Jannaschia aquimarina]|nr:hypothetical protein [Jannaschia aquimarina]